MKNGRNSTEELGENDGKPLDENRHNENKVRGGAVVSAVEKVNRRRVKA